MILTQAAPVLDACWYPGARTSDPASYCFLASVRDTPVKLLDASDGRVSVITDVIHCELKCAA